jgi:NAD(P)-dependent dehydrogenase (short-subunit alcohol dehydrogenase family)
MESWEGMLRVNTLAPWFLTKTVLPHMLKGNEVRVIFMTSGAGWSFLPGFGQYNVSKAALNSLTACFAEECHARYPDADIQMNGLDPGQAKTEMNPGSSRSPFSVATMALLLLSHPPAGPNGKFFSHDGRHLTFCNSAPYERSLI